MKLLPAHRVPKLFAGEKLVSLALFFSPLFLTEANPLDDRFSMHRLPSLSKKDFFSDVSLFVSDSLPYPLLWFFG